MSAAKRELAARHGPAGGANDGPPTAASRLPARITAGTTRRGAADLRPPPQKDRRAPAPSLPAGRRRWAGVSAASMACAALGGYEQAKGFQGRAALARAAAERQRQMRQLQRVTFAPPLALEHPQGELAQALFGTQVRQFVIAQHV